MKPTDDYPNTQPEQLPLGTRPLKVVNTVGRQLLALLGMVLIIIGFPIAILTPFPFVPIGVPVIILGVVLLGRFSQWGLNWMEGILKRFPIVEKFAPNWLMKVVFGRERRPAFKRIEQMRKRRKAEEKLAKKNPLSE